jgi:predicted NUDIX family NTP pyrophosphohydrolase
VNRAVSAGLLLYRTRHGRVEVLVAHPGGPFWATRDEGAWSIPKGVANEGEDLSAAAQREFVEETGFFVPETEWISLGTVQQRSGKTVYAWAVEGDADPSRMRSNTFSMEWPPRSGIIAEFPEIDRVEWFGVAEARRKLNPAQVAFLDRLLAKIDVK